ncbi:MAG: acetyltransferase [Pseudomonadales bacterium]
MNLIRGIVAALLLLLNTVAACIPLYLAALLRPLLGAGLTARLNRRLDHVIDFWVGNNRLMFRLLRLTQVSVTWEGAEALSRDRWYLIVSNHQSWSDILVLQHLFRDRVPPLKFFTKQQLIYVPLIGLALWILGFPYVRRASREQLAANPELAGRDREAALASCRRFENNPTSVLIFLEGTRFTPAKHGAQTARFQHLLNPKIGGMAYVITGLNDHLDRVIDVTIQYPEGIPTFWQLLQGRCRRVEVLVQCLELPAALRAAPDDETQRAALRPWVESLWAHKDARLRELRQLDGAQGNGR